MNRRADGGMEKGKKMCRKGEWKRGEGASGHQVQIIKEEVRICRGGLMNIPYGNALWSYGVKVRGQRLTEGLLHLLTAPHLVHKLPLERVDMGVQLEWRGGEEKKEKEEGVRILEWT